MTNFISAQDDKFFFRLRVTNFISARGDNFLFGSGCPFRFRLLVASKKQRQPRGLPLLRCWVRCLCWGRLAFAEAGLAAAFGFEDLLCFASTAGVYAGES